MKTWYRVKHWNNGRYGEVEVEAFEVEKETSQMIIYIDGNERESRQRKFSTDYTWCKSKNEAVAVAKKIVEKYIATAKAKIRSGKENLEELETYAKS